MYDVITGDFQGDPHLDEFLNTTVHDCFQKLMKGGVRGLVENNNLVNYS